nr:putative replication associated protein [Crucivirus sp.]
MPKASASKARARRWCFTIHDRDTAVKMYHNIDFQDKLQKRFSYVCFQLESAPSTTSLHVQGYLESKSLTSMKKIKEDFECDSMHLEASNGDAEQNKEYCSKSRTKAGEFMEWGTPGPGQGKRTDLANMYIDVQAGMPINELIATYPANWFRYGRNIMQLYSMRQPDIRPKLRIHYYYGPPRTGKSLLVRELLKETQGVFYANDTKEGWFDGYTGQSTVVFDEFRGKFPINDMLKILDHYPHRQQLKGAFFPLSVTDVYFTSNFAPESFYTGDEQPQWLSRIRGPRFELHEVLCAAQVQEKLARLSNLYQATVPVPAV